jgi:hypothetical protein
MHFHFIVLEAFRQHNNHCPTRNEDNAMCTKYEDYNVKLGANRGRESSAWGVTWHEVSWEWIRAEGRG